MPPAPPISLLTERLRLRRWRPDDRAPFAAMNADPEVMRYFPGPLSAADSDALADRLESGFEEQGFGLWAVERLDAGEFIGFTGLTQMHPGSPGAGGVEVGWRLSASAWGRGFATEAARAAVVDGWERWGLERIWSWTAVLNTPSQAVMRRLGMHEHARSMHPDLPEGHPLREHVTYVLDR